MAIMDFKTVVENSPEAIAVFDRNGTIIFSNQALVQLVGYTLQELNGISIFTLLTKESHEVIRNQLGLMPMGDGIQHRYMFDVLAKSGKRMTCDIVTSMASTTEGSELITAFVRDMTGMKVLEGRYSAERNKYLNLINESTSIILVLDQDLVLSLANRGFRERLGYADGSVVGKSIRDLRIIEPVVIDAMNDILRSQVTGGHRDFESQALTNEGVKMIVSWYLSPIKEADGSVSGVLAIGHDVTSKFQLESLYHSISKMLEIELSISHLTSTAVDSRLMMESALGLIQRMYGHEEGFAIDLRLSPDRSTIATTGDRLAHERIKEWISDKIEDFYEPALYPEDEALDGLEPFVNGLKSVVLLPLRGKGGVIGFICIGSENQKVLSQNEKDAMVGVISMLGYAYENVGLTESLRRSKDQISLLNDILLHDIANYLVPMRAYLDLLKESDSRVGKGREYLERAMSSDEALNYFVQDVKLLMYAKNTELDVLVPVPLLDELRNAIGVSAGRFGGAKVDLIADGGGPVNVLADHALYHLFTNLITNAIKHSSPKPVTVRVSKGMEKGWVEVRVEDEGPGIPKDRKGLVFDRGFSEPSGKVAKSTGIGLSIVSALTQKYQGKVRVEDRVPDTPSSGARFVVELRSADQ
jgi:PAS domain S-box-containing protein